MTGYARDVEYQTFEFRFTGPYRLAGLAFGVMPSTCRVLVGTREVRIQFGLWSARVEIDNIADAAIGGPYSFVKTAGPAHLSLADGGVTFATNGERGVCLTLHQPVPAIAPTPRLKHPNITVTVADCDGLIKSLKGARG